MSKSLKIILWGAGGLIIACGLLTAGFIVGRVFLWNGGFRSGSMMSGWGFSQPQTCCADGSIPGWNGTSGRSFRRFGPGMMWGQTPGYSVPSSRPLTLDEAHQAVESYLASQNWTGFIIDEIMIFDNQAYAEIIEESTGIGAMELLVDASTGSVTPEPGPNMMWNLKYSPMSSRMHRPGSEDISSEMPVSPEQAVKLAQNYLDQYLPGVDADEHVDPFYGYYTIHTIEGGQIVGMLSVNGFSGDVFLHTWHGTFIEMSEEEHD